MSLMSPKSIRRIQSCTITSDARGEVYEFYRDGERQRVIIDTSAFEQASQAARALIAPWGGGARHQA